MENTNILILSNQKNYDCTADNVLCSGVLLSVYEFPIKPSSLSENFYTLTTSESSQTRISRISGGVFIPLFTNWSSETDQKYGLKIEILPGETYSNSESDLHTTYDGKLIDLEIFLAKLDIIDLVQSHLLDSTTPHNVYAFSDKLLSSLETIDYQSISLQIYEKIKRHSKNTFVRLIE